MTAQLQILHLCLKYWKHNCSRRIQDFGSGLKEESGKNFNLKLYSFDLFFRTRTLRNRPPPEFVKKGEVWDELTSRALKQGYDPIKLETFFDRPSRMANMPLEIVINSGYTFYEMIISCVYGISNKECQDTDVVWYFHDEMYNCYTLRLNSTYFTKSGVQHGLTLILYIGKSRKIS